MSENKIDRGGDLIRIHRVFTRGIEVSLQKAKEFQQNGFPDEQLQEGYVLYLRGLMATLRAHHEGEDTISFPFLKGKGVSAAFDQLMKDHQVIEMHLDGLDSSIEKLTQGDARPALSNLQADLGEIQTVWPVHIGKEEQMMLTSAVKLLTIEEEMQMGQLLGQHAQQHGGPGYLSIPFVLFNLVPSDRALMAHNFPPTVVEQLIPGPWKAQWAPMKPFLLD